MLCFKKKSLLNVQSQIRSPNRCNVSPESTVTKFELDFLLYTDISFYYQKEVNIFGGNRKYLLCIKRLKPFHRLSFREKCACPSYLCHLKTIFRLNIQVILYTSTNVNILSLFCQIQPTPGHRPTEPAPSVLLLHPLRDR